MRSLFLFTRPAVEANRRISAVTATYKGTPKNGKPILLRSYDSRAEPPPEFDCKIWEAGRATCATGLAFKPIQIGQSVFIDEGAGKYNPAPQILDEGVCKEWPGREMGVFVSVGTGKRPGGTNHQQHLWWEGFVSSNIGDFAEARRRLVAKIEGCEETHQYMLKEYLSKRNVLIDNYYRLNVEVGVGEFGMNEWNRLAEISTNTRMYLSRTDVQQINTEAAVKVARIHRAKSRWERLNNDQRARDGQPFSQVFSDTVAVELPGDEIVTPSSLHHSELPTAHVAQETQLKPQFQNHLNRLLSSPQTSPNHQHQDGQSALSADMPPSTDIHTSPRPSIELISPVRASNELQGSEPPSSSGSYDPSTRRSTECGQEGRISPYQHPPPLPPKGPKYYGDGQQELALPPQPNPYRRPEIQLPYPDDDGPPPLVNMTRKPNLSS